MNTSLPSTDERTAEERFTEFAESNPRVEQLLTSLTREWLRRTDRPKVGIAMVWERMRWEYHLETGETPKLNNDYKAWYARKIMTENTDLAGVFETRRSAADRAFGLVRWPGADGPRLDGGLW